MQPREAAPESLSVGSCLGRVVRTFAARTGRGGRAHPPADGGLSTRRALGSLRCPRAAVTSCRPSLVQRVDVGPRTAVGVLNIPAGAGAASPCSTAKRACPSPPLAPAPPSPGHCMHHRRRWRDGRRSEGAGVHVPWSHPIPPGCTPKPPRQQPSPLSGTATTGKEGACGCTQQLARDYERPTSAARRQGSEVWTTKSSYPVITTVPTVLQPSDLGLGAVLV